MRFIKQSEIKNIFFYLEFWLSPFNGGCLIFKEELGEGSMGKFNDKPLQYHFLNYKCLEEITQEPAEKCEDTAEPKEEENVETDVVESTESATESSHENSLNFEEIDASTER